MAQLFTHENEEERNPGGLPRKNGLTSSLSIPKEDDPGTLSETCRPPLLPTCLVTLRYNLVISYMASKHKQIDT